MSTLNRYYFRGVLIEGFHSILLEQTLRIHLDFRKMDTLKCECTMLLFVAYRGLMRKVMKWSMFSALWTN